MKMFISLFLFLFLCLPEAKAVLLINEFLADPPAGIGGDMNQDGIRHASDDEFIEFYNSHSAILDLSGWSIRDSDEQRHLFAEGTLLEAYGVLVIFGGGDPQNFNVPVLTASSGRLSLNNSSDQIILTNKNGLIIETLTYGTEANNDQSLTRIPDGLGPFLPHHNHYAFAASPGEIQQKKNEQNISPAPEPFYLFGAGLLFLFLFKRSRLLMGFQSYHHPSFGTK